MCFKVFRDDTNLLQNILSCHLSNTSECAQDLTAPYVRSSLVDVYPLFFFLYAVEIILGMVASVSLLVYICRQRLHRQALYVLWANMAISNIMQCTVVMPLTLVTLLIQNWVFGSFLCYFLPMLQRFPMYATTLTFIVIAVHRYRLMALKPESNALLFSAGCWILSIFFVLPKIMFLRFSYLDNTEGSKFAGVSFCILTVKDMEVYARVMFVCLFFAPVCLVTYINIRISREIQVRQYRHEDSIRYGRSQHSRSLPANSRERNEGSPGSIQGDYGVSSSNINRMQPAVKLENLTNGEDDSIAGSADVCSPTINKIDNNNPVDEEEDNFDAQKERRTQQYQVWAFVLFCVCIFPLLMLLMVHHFVFETDSNTAYYDVIYLVFTWLSFLPTITIPTLFFMWTLSDATKDRLMTLLRRHR